MISSPATTWRMVIAYNGARFKGWQRGNGRTVQGTLEEAFAAVVSEAGAEAGAAGVAPAAAAAVGAEAGGGEIRVHGAGRTDAGAHAEGQVASVVLPGAFEPDDLLSKVNQALPGDVAVLSLEPADDRFHARYLATAKTYRYRIVDGPVPNPFLAHLSWRQLTSLDADAMLEAARAFVGTHDFAAFTQAKTKKNTERTVLAVDIERAEFAGGPVLEVHVRGNGFLWKQVRSMVGSLVEAGHGRLSPGVIASLLESGDRSHTYITAPACGLTLVAVEYA